MIDKRIKLLFILLSRLLKELRASTHTQDLHHLHHTLSFPRTPPEQTRIFGTLNLSVVEECTISHHNTFKDFHRLSSSNVKNQNCEPVVLTSSVRFALISSGSIFTTPLMLFLLLYCFTLLCRAPS